MKQRYSAAILVVLLIGTIAKVFPQPEMNFIPPYRLAFASFAPQDTDIFIAEADGSNIRPFLSSSAMDYNASFSKDGNWVVFTSNRNGPTDLYRAHPDGTGLEQLTHTDSFDDQAVFSPDGKLLAFVSTLNGQADIYIMDLATRKTTNITNDPAGDFRPAWSPDSKQIAFSTDRYSKKVIKNFTLLHSTEICTVNIDGSGLMRRTHMNAFAGSPSWSPDGKQLVYFEVPDLESVRSMNTIIRIKASTQLVVIDLQDDKKHFLTNEIGEKICPRWLSPDNIAYVAWGELDQPNGIKFSNEKKEIKGEFMSPSWSGDGRKIIFHRPMGSETPPFSNAYSKDNDFELVRTGIFPSFSPSGQQIVCNDNTAGILHNQIILMNADGSDRSVLYGDSTKSALAPVWSPDGEKIAFGLGDFFVRRPGPVIARYADIAVMNKDGSGLTILTDGKANYALPSWSPDGKKIVCRVILTDSVNNSTDPSKDKRFQGLSIIEVETGKIVPLTTDMRDNFPGWSPTDDVIAFTRKVDNNFDIYTIKIRRHGFEKINNRSWGRCP